MTALLELFDRHPLFTGWTGAIASLGASSVHLLEHMDLYLRVGTQAVGLLIALLTLPMTIGKFVEWARRTFKKHS